MHTYSKFVNVPLSKNVYQRNTMRFNMEHVKELDARSVNSITLRKILALQKKTFLLIFIDKRDNRLIDTH